METVNAVPSSTGPVVPTPTVLRQKVARPKRQRKLAHSVVHEVHGATELRVFAGDLSDADGRADYFV